MNEKEKLIQSLKKDLDISSQKIESLEKELADNKDFRMTIISNLSHELRTPLNGIIGFSEMLSTTTTTEDEQKLYSGVIAESSIMLMSILNEVFDIARIEANRFKAYSVAFDLNDLIYNLFVDFKNKAEEKGLQLFLENLISESFIVYSDPDIVKRILIKLLENAIKFTKKGWVKLKYTQQKDKIIFSIEDTGIGISETLWSNLFNRFIREEVSKSRNIGGTGLDLTLCNGLVKLLNGEIWYESKGKEGSIFKFSFLSSDK